MRQWEQWQASSVSQRHLSELARQKGHTVLRVPPPLRAEFCEVAKVFTLYDKLFHKAQRQLSHEQLAAFRVWHDATQALLASLHKEPAGD